MNSLPGKSRMRYFVKIALLFCVPAAFSGVSQAQDPDPVQILKRAAATYQNLKTYQARVTVDTVEGTKTSDRHFVETGSGAAFRVEDEDAQGLLRLDDGRTEWTLDRKTNQYAKATSGEGQPSYIGELARMDQNVKDAEVLREDLFETNGQTARVYIVEVVRDRWPAGTPADVEFATVRIDENTFEIYGANIYTKGPTEIRRYSITKRNQPVDKTFFAFSAPPSAKEVGSLQSQAAAISSVIGIDAPDFTLADASGHSYHLRDLRGKVVVIDFWATWCAPCRAQMPYLQQINDQYAQRGVVVLGLDSGEDAATVKEYTISTNYTFPLLLGAEPSVTTQYFVDAYPTTLVIDRNGKIIYRAAGTDGPGILLSTVKRAAAR
jgi:thiol-disulfide isomerase/thioredoxin